MDDVRVLLETIAEKGLAAGRLRGVFNLLIGRRVAKADGTAVSAGLTWRQLASVLKVAKFDKELVRELDADPDVLAPRDREKMWYVAIGLARVDSLEAISQADQLVPLLKPLGYVVGQSPTTISSASANEDAAAARKKKK